jgi:hypothetical protein
MKDTTLRLITVTDLVPGDHFRFPTSSKVYRCHRVSKLFKSKDTPSDKCYLSTGNSGRDCIVGYPAADMQVYLVPSN